MNIKRITLPEIEYTAHRLAQQAMIWDEPIPAFNTRFPHSLESCVNTPFQTYARKPLYRGLVGKAAILFYLMIKNHPFENGNKRVAVMTLLYFLGENNKWLKISINGLYRFAVDVAKSKAEEKDSIIASVERFLKAHIIPYTS